MDSKDQYSAWADQYAEEYGISKYLIKSIISCESAWNPNAISPAGAVGLCQFMAPTAKDMGLKVDPENDIDERLDPEKSIKACAKYLKWLWDYKWFDVYFSRRKVDMVVAAYNAGIGRVVKAAGVPLIRETQNYVQRVTDLADDLEADDIVESHTGCKDC